MNLKPKHAATASSSWNLFRDPRSSNTRERPAVCSVHSVLTIAAHPGVRRVAVFSWSPEVGGRQAGLYTLRLAALRTRLPVHELPIGGGPKRTDYQRKFGHVAEGHTTASPR